MPEKTATIPTVAPMAAFIAIGVGTDRVKNLRGVTRPATGTAL
jgi:hypothetical protein